MCKDIWNWKSGFVFVQIQSSYDEDVVVLWCDRQNALSAWAELLPSRLPHSGDCPIGLSFDRGARRPLGLLWGCSMFCLLASASCAWPDLAHQSTCRRDGCVQCLTQCRPIQTLLSEPPVFCTRFTSLSVALQAFRVIAVGSSQSLCWLVAQVVLQPSLDTSTSVALCHDSVALSVSTQYPSVFERGFPACLAFTWCSTSVFCLGAQSPLASAQLPCSFCNLCLSTRDLPCCGGNGAGGRISFISDEACNRSRASSWSLTARGWVVLLSHLLWRLHVPLLTPRSMFAALIPCAGTSFAVLVFSSGHARPCLPSECAIAYCAWLLPGWPCSLHCWVCQNSPSTWFSFFLPSISSAADFCADNSVCRWQSLLPQAMPSSVLWTADAIRRGLPCSYRVLPGSLPHLSSAHVVTSLCTKRTPCYKPGCCQRLDELLVQAVVPGPPLLGVRVGEASNPGRQADIRHFFANLGPASGSQTSVTSAVPCPASPSEHSPVVGDQGQPAHYSVLPAVTGDQFTVAVVNPTSVHGKTATLLELGAQVVLMSETSAVSEVQLHTQRQLKARGFFSVWGQPVQPHMSRRTGEATLRGHALGVAIASSFPLHQPPVPLPAELHSTQRLTEGMLRVGSLQLRVITVYGFPSTYVEAKARNQQLLQMALDRIALSRVPTLIGGDMNMSVLDLPIWEQFSHLGYRELFEFYAARHGCLLPPTCRNATRNDTVLLPPILQSSLLRAEVDSRSKLFDTHDPLKVTFSMPPVQAPRAWRMPRPWTDYGPDMARAAQIYEGRHFHVRDAILGCKDVNEVSSAFALWAEALEESVDCAIQAAHVADPVAQPHARLPKAAKGRCQYRQRVPTAHPHVSSRARAGGYDPVCEAMTMSSRRKVKQVRRVHALWQGCCTLHRRAREQGTFCPRLTKQLRAEWEVIRKNKAFGPRFDSWLLGYEMFGQVWLDLPPPDWLRDVLQVARHACDAQVRSEAALRKQRFRYLVQMDTLFAGQKQGFNQLRPKPRPQSPACQ